MNGFFSTEGPVWQFLDKAGHLILLNLVWLLCCLPVITIIPATTAFYYATIKSIRRGYGYPFREFFESFRRNLPRGIPINIILGGLAGLLVYDMQAIGGDTSTASTGSVVQMMIYMIFLFVIVGFTVYICPVLSRFCIQMSATLRMTFLMVFRHLPVTILLIAGTCGCGVLIASAVYAAYTASEGGVSAAAFIMLLPGAWCYLSTFLVEPVLKKYMPPKQEGDREWYYE